MPAIIKPSRLSIAHQTEPSRDGALTTVSAHVLFDFADPKRFLTEQALWPMVTEQMPNGAIFDKGQAKPKAELIIAGCALSPTDDPIEGIRVSARFGPFRKQLAVFGDRFWQRTEQGVRMSRPAPFLKMPIGDVQAFGGQGYTHNPRGKGFGARTLLEAGFDVPLPNVENPARLIKTIEDRPTPVHFGPIPADDPARLTLLGTYDQHWIDNVSPLKPEDFNPLYHCEAPHDQRFGDFFAGGETFEISGMSRGESSVGGQLPRLTARCFYERAQDGSLHETGMRCDTVTLFPNVGKATLTFRGLIRGEDRFAEDIASIMLAMEDADAAPRDAAYYADVHQKRRSKSEGHKYALADYQLMPQVDEAVLSARRQAKLDQAAASRQKFMDNQDWATGKMLEDEGLPAGLLPARDTSALDDIPLVAAPTREELENGDLDIAALLDDVKAVEDALLEKRDREMVKAELQRRAILAVTPLDRLPPGIKTPVVDDELMARYPDVALDPELVEGLDQMKGDLAALRDQGGAAPSAGTDDDTVSPELRKLAEQLGDEPPVAADDAEAAFDTAAARAMRLPEGSLLAEFRKAVSEMDLSGLALPKSGSAEATEAAPQTDAPALSTLPRETLAPRLENAPGQPGSDPGQVDVFSSMLDELMAHVDSAEPDGLQPPAHGAPAETGQTSIDTAMERLEEAEATVDENMVMARQHAPTPLFPLDPLPDGVATRLGAFVSGKLKDGHDFKGGDLAGADLRGIDFSGLDLTETFFEQADLTGARFHGCNLTGAVFTGATLDEADFTGTDLTHANLSKVSARNLVLDRTRLRDLLVFQSDFSGSAGSRAELEQVRFIESTLNGVQLNQSRITDCQVLSGRAEGFAATASKVLRSMFVLVSMTGMDFSDSDLERIGFVEVRAPGADCRNGKWNSVGFMGDCDLTGSRFDALDATESSFNMARMAESCFLRARGNTCFFNSCDLEANDFRLSSFRNSMFGRSNFQGSDFFGANLFMAALTGADLRHCSMRAANLYAANLLEAKLAACDLSGANLGLTLLEQPTHA